MFIWILIATIRNWNYILTYHASFSICFFFITHINHNRSAEPSLCEDLAGFAMRLATYKSRRDDKCVSKCILMPCAMCSVPLMGSWCVCPSAAPKSELRFFPSFFHFSRSCSAYQMIFLMCLTERMCVCTSVSVCVCCWAFVCLESTQQPQQLKQQQQRRQHPNYLHFETFVDDIFHENFNVFCSIFFCP